MVYVFVLATTFKLSLGTRSVSSPVIRFPLELKGPGTNLSLSAEVKSLCVGPLYFIFASYHIPYCFLKRLSFVTVFIYISITNQCRPWHRGILGHSSPAILNTLFGAADSSCNVHEQDKISGWIRRPFDCKNSGTTPFSCSYFHSRLLAKARSVHRGTSWFMYVISHW